MRPLRVIIETGDHGAGNATSGHKLAPLRVPRHATGDIQEECKAMGRKKVTRKKPAVAKRKPEGRRGRVKPTGKVIEPTETATT
jgi:hypothetical protein